MKKLELNQMEGLKGEGWGSLCAITGFLYFPAQTSIGLGPVARGIAGACLRN